jgi:hypothetical protein
MIAKDEEVAPMSRNSAVPLLFGTCFLIALPISAQDSGQSRERHEGTAPRASAAKYRSHAEKDEFSLGAEFLPKKQASKVFAADVNSCCLVVQVAVYPEKDNTVDLSLFDFSLVEVKTDNSVRPESPTTVAARLEKKKNPPHGVDVATYGRVGYESGTYADPVTGQPVHVQGVSTSAGVGVANGNSVPPDIADHDREMIERELYEKGLPEGKVSVPVAGFLYFALPNAKKNAKYQLVYSGRSEPIILPLQ